MGNFIGHILPGSLFIIFAILWTLNLLRYYFRIARRKQNGLALENVNFEWKNYSRPVESLVLVAVLPIAILGEYLTGFEDGPLICPDNVQHMTMYLFFLILFVVNLMEIYAFSPLPTMVEPLFGFAFGVEALLLYFHTHGQGPVEQHLHKLLTFAAFMCSLCSFLAGVFRKDVITQLAKPLFVLLQGQWFVQIAFLLYPPFSLHHPVKPNHHNLQPANGTLAHLNSSSVHVHELHVRDLHDLHAPDDHRSIMITTAYFCWHFAFALVTILSLAIICRKRYFKQELLNEKYIRLLEETST